MGVNVVSPVTQPTPVQSVYSCCGSFSSIPSSQWSHLLNGPTFPMVPSSKRSHLPTRAIFPMVSSSEWSHLPNGTIFQMAPSSKRSRLPNGPVFQMVPPTQWSRLPNGPTFPMVPPSEWSFLLSQRSHNSTGRIFSGEFHQTSSPANMSLIGGKTWYRVKWYRMEL